MKNNAAASLKPSKKRKRKKKGKVVQLLEYGAVCAFLPMIRIIPLRLLHVISSLLGALIYQLLEGRRRIAVENVRQALGSEKDQEEIERIARRSCQSFVLTCPNRQVPARV
jgi:lauroyl/myristoyl acyltransferase